MENLWDLAKAVHLLAQMENLWDLAKAVHPLAQTENLCHPEKEALLTLVLVDLADLVVLVI